LKIGEAYNDHKKESDKKDKIQMLIAEASSIKLADGVKLIHGDFTEKLDEILETNSIRRNENFRGVRVTMFLLLPT
jgi:hypothetical protein